MMQFQNYSPIFYDACVEKLEFSTHAQSPKALFLTTLFSLAQIPASFATPPPTLGKLAGFPSPSIVPLASSLQQTALHYALCTVRTVLASQQNTCALYLCEVCFFFHFLSSAHLYYLKYNTIFL